MRRLPPLNSLRAFEAAARLSSVTAAAEELGVSHSAVSQQVKQLERAVNQIKDPRAVALATREVKILEAQGDTVYHDAMAALFAGNPDPLDVMKWKEIYDTIEETLDRCQTVAIVLESISLKNS